MKFIVAHNKKAEISYISRVEKDLAVEEPKEKCISLCSELKEVIDNISFTNTILDFKWKFKFKSFSSLDFYDDGRADKDIIGWFVWAEFERPDTNTGEIGIGKGRMEFVPIGATETYIVNTCWILVELLIRHELMEAFRYKNNRISNPHATVYERMEKKP